MNPEDLSVLIKNTATAVLTEHELDASVLPETVTVERPRNPEHGDYAFRFGFAATRGAAFLHPCDYRVPRGCLRRDYS